MKKTIALFLMACTLLQPVAYADDATPDEGEVKIVKTGEPVPFDGVLMTEQRAQSVRLKLLDLQYQSKQVEIASAENTVNLERLNGCQRHNEALATEINEEKDNSFLSKVGFFILGAGMASLVAFGAARAVR